MKKQNWTVDSSDKSKIEINFPEDNIESKTLDWLNWITINVNEVDDYISFNVSTGDPRGAQYQVKIQRDNRLKTKQQNLNVTIRETEIYTPFIETSINGEVVKKN